MNSVNFMSYAKNYAIASRNLRYTLAVKISTVDIDSSKQRFQLTGGNLQSSENSQQ